MMGFSADRPVTRARRAPMEDAFAGNDSFSAPLTRPLTRVVPTRPCAASLGANAAAMLTLYQLNPELPEITLEILTYL
ncbi:hypothetical protein PG987_013091 [Apiospora arundinis]